MPTIDPSAGVIATTNALQVDIGAFFAGSWPVLVGLFLLILLATGAIRFGGGLVGRLFSWGGGSRRR